MYPAIASKDSLKLVNGRGWLLLRGNITIEETGLHSGIQMENITIEDTGLHSGIQMGNIATEDTGLHRGLHKGFN